MVQDKSSVQPFNPKIFFILVATAIVWIGFFALSPQKEKTDPKAEPNYILFNANSVKVTDSRVTIDDNEEVLVVDNEVSHVYHGVHADEVITDGRRVVTFSTAFGYKVYEVDASPDKIRFLRTLEGGLCIVNSESPLQKWQVSDGKSLTPALADLKVVESKTAKWAETKNEILKNDGRIFFREKQSNAMAFRE